MSSGALRGERLEQSEHGLALSPDSKVNTLVDHETRTLCYETSGMIDVCRQSLCIMIGRANEVRKIG